MQVNNINNQFNTTSTAVPKKRKRTAVNFTANKNQSTYNENNQKIGLRKASIEVLKGFVSPVTSMFSSPKNFLIGSGIIAANGLLIVATCGSITPLLAAAGVVTGAVQGIKTVSAFKNAKNSTDKEKAFYEAGETASTLGMSILGAKPALKQAGIITKDMSTLEATAKCFTTAKSSIQGSYNSFKTGLWKSCLNELKKPLVRNHKLYAYAKKLNKEAQQHTQEVLKEIQDILPEELKGKLTVRAKSTKSIYNKLERKSKDGSTYENYEAAKKRIKDLIGIRFELDNPSKEQTELLNKTLINAIQKKKINILEVENYFGNPESAYFSEEQSVRLGLAANIDAFNGPKDSGYITTQLNLIHKNGMHSELQIRGKEISNLAEVEHILYNFREGKDISNGILKLKELWAPIHKVANKIKAEEFAKYQEYLFKMYDYARNQELGITTEKPVLPEGLNKSLGIENIEKMHNTQIEIEKNNTPIKDTAYFTTAMAYSKVNNSKKDYQTNNIYNKI